MGSSRKTTGGRPISARHKDSFRFWPPERAPAMKTACGFSALSSKCPTLRGTAKCLLLIEDRGMLNYFWRFCFILDCGNGRFEFLPMMYSLKLKMEPQNDPTQTLGESPFAVVP